MTRADYEVIVVGAGAVGLAGALALARAGFSTCLLGPAPERRDGRTAALMSGSMDLMGSLGLSDRVRDVAAPLRALRIVDDTGSLFRPPPATFRSAEIGLEAFGWNIENAALVGLLAGAARASGLAWREDLAAGIAPDGEVATVTLASGAALTTRLVVGADGRRSRVREVARIATRSWTYPQAAITTLLAHERAHEDISTEFHTRAGPFTLVPLPGRRSSLVWVMRPAEAERMGAVDDLDFARAVERRSHGTLGRMSIDGPRGTVPLGGASVARLVESRVALIGEAAHLLPPIGAQGLNLGLADVTALVRTLRDAKRGGLDLGSGAALAPYDRARRGEIGLRTLAVDRLNRALLSDLVPMDALRGIGLGALSRIGPLRRAVMRAGLA